MSLLVIPRLVQLSVKRFKGISFEKVILLIKKATSGLQGKRGVKAFYYLNKAFLASSVGVCKKREISFFVSKGKMLRLVCDELLREDGRC